MNRRPEHLTEREEQILRCIRRWITEHGEGPSVRQIADDVGRVPPQQSRKAARRPGPRRARLAHLPPAAVTAGARQPSRGHVMDFGGEAPTAFWVTVQFRKDGPRVEGQWTGSQTADRKYLGFVGDYGSRPGTTVSLIKETAGGECRVRRTWPENQVPPSSAAL